MSNETRETHTSIRLTQRETEALEFIIQTLHINSSEAMRRSITYYAFDLASSIAEPIESNFLGEVGVDANSPGQGQAG